MRITTRLLLPALLLTPVSAAISREVPMVDVARCAQIAQPLDRLECYDSLVRGLPIDSLAPAAPAAPAASAAPAATVSPAEPGPGTGTTARIGLPEDNDRRSIEQSFGLKDDPSPALSTLSTNLDGTFTGWQGGTTFRLANGQVWRQVGVNIYNQVPTENPAVTITKQVKRNSYMLKVDRVMSKIQVVRIR